MLGLKLKGMDKFILTTTELTAKVEDPQLENIMFLTDRLSSQTMEREEEKTLKQFIVLTIQDEQITTHTQNEEIKKLLTMIYDKMN